MRMYLLSSLDLSGGYFRVLKYHLACTCILGISDLVDWGKGSSLVLRNSSISSSESIAYSGFFLDFLGATDDAVAGRDETGEGIGQIQDSNGCRSVLSPYDFTITSFNCTASSMSFWTTSEFVAEALVLKRFRILRISLT